MLQQEQVKLKQKLEDRKMDQANLTSELWRMEYQEKGVRELISYNVKRIGCLKREFDKQIFANKAYRRKDLVSFSSGELEIDLHNLQCGISHGTNSLAEERKMLKKIKNNTQKESDISRLPIEEIESRMYRFESLAEPWRWVPPFDVAEKEKVVKQLKEHKWAWETSFADSPVKGKIWNQLNSKQEIQDQIKIEEKAADELKKKHMKIREEFKKIKKDLRVAEKDINCIQEQLPSLRRNEDESRKTSSCVQKKIWKDAYRFGKYP